MSARRGEHIVRLRERGYRRARTRRACLWPRLAGLARPEPPRRSARVRRRWWVEPHSTALVGQHDSVAPLSEHPRFFVQSVAGFASFYLRGLSPGASSGGAAAFRAEKSLLIRFSPCICEISTADAARGSICHGHFSPNSTPMPQFSSNWLGTCRSRSADARIATFVALSLSGFCLLSTVPGFLPRLKPQLEPRHPRYQTIAIRSKVGMGLNFKIILKLFSRNFH